MKRTIILIVLIFLSALFYGNEILTFDEYVKVISEKLPEIKLNNNEVTMQELEVKKSYSAFDVKSGIKLYGQGSQTYPDNENTIYNYSPGFGSALTLTNTLPSGTELSAGVTYRQTYSGGEVTSANTMTGSSTTAGWQKTTYNPVVNIVVTQPLLYNWFGFLDRYSIKNEQNKLKIEKIIQELNNLNILNDYKKVYFQWIALNKKLELIDKTIKNTELQVSLINNKVNLGLLEKDCLETIRYSLLQYEKQKKEYQFNYEKLKNQLSSFFDIQSYQPEDTFFNQKYEEYLNKNFDFIDFVKTKNSQILNISKSNYELLKKARKNETLPHFNLFANLDINFYYAEEISDGEKTTYTFYDNNYKNVDFTTGIEFSLPLGNINARSNLKEAQLLIDNIVLEYKKTKKKYDNQLMNVLSCHQYIKNLIDLNNQSLESLSSKYTIQLDQFKKGMTDLQNIVDTDTSITTEKMNEIDIKVNLINNLLDYEYLTE